MTDSKLTAAQCVTAAQIILKARQWNLTAFQLVAIFDLLDDVGALALAQANGLTSAELADVVQVVKLRLVRNGHRYAGKHWRSVIDVDAA